MRGRSNLLDEWGKVEMGGAAARSSARLLGNPRRGSACLLVRHAHRSCGGTPHPASPRFASLTKAPHPSPTRGEETSPAEQRFACDCPHARRGGALFPPVSPCRLTPTPSRSPRRTCRSAKRG